MNRLTLLSVLILTLTLAASLPQTHAMSAPAPLQTATPAAAAQGNAGVRGAVGGQGTAAGADQTSATTGRRGRGRRGGAGRGAQAAHPEGTPYAGTTTTLVADLMKSAGPDGMVHVIMETEKGKVDLALDVKHAPITCKGFLDYVDAGCYTGGTFFRVTSRTPGRGGIVIAQCDVAPNSKKFPPFPLETTAMTGIIHTTTTLSMPRWNEPNSATSGVSIMVGESPSLNYRPPTGGRGANLGYATFGHVVGGWDVIQKIHDSPSHGTASNPNATDRTLDPPIKILKAYRVIPAK